MPQAQDEPSGGSCSRAEVRVLLMVTHVLLKMLTVTPALAKPAGKEAQRILGFFMSSLANRQLGKPPPLVRELWAAVSRGHH